jgi:lipoyl(octanoyl) transferase
MATADVEWLVSKDLASYPEAVSIMESRVEAIYAGQKPELIWLLEHPSLYTAGVSAHSGDLLRTDVPVFQTRRGGQYTYHGPGQRVVYVMLDVAKRGGDVRKFVWQLEEWIIQTLLTCGINGERRKGRIGIWVVCDQRELKIAAIGIKLRKWVSFHGISININPDLSYFSGIVPCGLQGYGVTSVNALDPAITQAQIDEALYQAFEKVF